MKRIVYIFISKEITRESQTHHNDSDLFLHSYWLVSRRSSIHTVTVRMLSHLSAIFGRMTVTTAIFATLSQYDVGLPFWSHD